MMIERQGLRSEPHTYRFPEVRGGICEYCGVMDGNVDSQNQYKLCPHFRGMQLMCSYCPSTKNPDEVIKRSTLNIHRHPQNPETLVVVCDSFECSDKHIKRFQLGS